LYRTGDLGRRRKDGRLEYVRREDRRVEVGGRRVEAGEIEAWVKGYGGVKEAVARVGSEGGEVVVWLVGEEGAKVVGAEVKEYMRERLGEGMVPEKVMVVEKIPQRVGGGVDYRALEGMLGGGAVEYVGPRNGVEEQVAEIWKQILGVEKVGVKDNFFQIGGHSLLATQVVARMSSVFGVEIALRRLFESPTVAELAQVVEKAVQSPETNGKAGAVSPIRRVAREAVVISS